MSVETYSRRYFLEAGAVSALGFGLYHLLNVTNQFTVGHDFELQELQIPPKEKQLPPELIGVGVNAPYLWSRSPEYQFDMLTTLQAAKMGPIRLYIYPDPACFRQVHELCYLARRISAGREHKLTFIVSLFDGYHLLHAAKPNVWYGSGQLTSPYLYGATEKSEITQAQENFFVNPEVRFQFHAEQRKQVESLRHLREIVAWEVANELEISDEIADPDTAQEILTEWYGLAVANIREVSRHTPIITGLAKPWLIDEAQLVTTKTINSLHMYPHLFPTMQEQAGTHAAHSSLPLMVTEIGVSNKMPLTDELLAQFISSTIESLTKDRMLFTQHLSVWKWDEYLDTFDFSLEEYPQTFELLQKLQKSFRVT